MDGIKRPVNNSLQIKLSLWLSLAILIIALIAGILAFFSAYNEARGFQDRMLRQIAALFDQYHLPVPQESASGKKTGRNMESHVFVQLLPTPTSSSIGRITDQNLALPQNLPDGTQSISIGNIEYRVFIRTVDSGNRLAVAQQTAFRDEMARETSLLTLLPLLISVPILLLVVAVLIRRIFRNVVNLSIEIDQRGVQELQPIVSAPLPSEIRPFVEAINRLLARVELSIDTQRRFLADAAHELRSPFTALSLQAERLENSEMSAKAREQLNSLRQGIERGRLLLNQLLTLTRAQTSATIPGSNVSIHQVYRRVLEDLLPLAEVKKIDIGVVGDLDAHVLVNEVDLISLVKNLVDNAIRYTPAGGRVDLSVLADNGVITLTVEDSGPGIPEAERERVFDPFYRILGSDEIGSGLGLSIVQTISARIGAKISLGFANEQSKSGLRVRVVFPPGKKLRAPINLPAL